jgi:hypothetical protein
VCESTPTCWAPQPYQHHKLGQDVLDEGRNRTGGFLFRFRVNDELLLEGTSLYVIEKEGNIHITVRSKLDLEMPMRMCGSRV